MTIQISIIGLGQIGASVGLALQNQQGLLRRVGHDRDLERLRQAEKIGAVDKGVINLPAAVREADLVLLSLPMDSIRDTMAIIAPELKEGAVLVDTGPVKEVTAAWAGELLLPNRHYIGLTPVLNPAYLHIIDSGQEGARADLFRGGVMAIVSPPRTSSEALKLVADLTRLIGATPLFADPLEIDSLMSAMYLLPQLVAAALVNSTVDQPGWREGRKIAGSAFAEATAPIGHLSEPKTLRASVLLNRENTLRWMDSMLAALQAIRSDIAAQDAEGLDERLERARRGRDRWWRERQVGDWAAPEAVPVASAPAAPDLFGRLFGRRTKK